MKSKLKHIGSLFLLLAGSVILAHALVPHHQHDGQPFFGISSCHHTHTNQHEADGHTTACNHDHSENEASDCALHHLLVIPGKQIKAQQATVISCLLKNYSLTTSELFKSQLITNTCDWRYHIEGTIPLPASIYASTKGLRAPPMV
ncbi:hypothetical protein [Maribellus sediminis]|uniref:hypothetical protein n=1 Tax=Maribellus sediminis TaxID=2696285 RepID=UPI001431C3DC|nr:hypothetical protein [Maribellus sediminis]